MKDVAESIEGLMEKGSVTLYHVKWRGKHHWLANCNRLFDLGRPDEEDTWCVLHVVVLLKRSHREPSQHLSNFSALFSAFLQRWKSENQGSLLAISLAILRFVAI